MPSYRLYFMMEKNNTEQNKIPYYKGLLVGVILTGIVGYVWSLEAENRGRWAVEKDALLTGVAKYGVDSVSGKPIFQWNK